GIVFWHEKAVAEREAMSMTQKASPHIDLGPGGSIPATDENRELLERIKAAPPLEPLQLFVLANFYHVYQANTFLADHLTLIGASQSLFLSTDWGDLWEDLWGYDNTSEENREKLALRHENLNLNFQVYRGGAYKGQRRSKYPLTYADYDIKCIPSLIPGLGLLIETHHGDDPHIIGVCPELGS